ncbi:hypothetical protein BTVI_139527 [Pitangus sulphuratus]|nr:hypothetical protein BTVI_139527 [Pitangus sulphuratus]
MALHQVDSVSIQLNCIFHTLQGRTQRVIVNVVTPDWRPVTNGVPLGSILSPVLFNIFINDLNKGLEGILSKFAENIELGGATKSLEGREALQRVLDKSER